MRARLCLIAAVSVVAVVTAGCSSRDAATAPTTDIPIGVDIEVTGAYAVQGSAYRNALTLVADRVNEDKVLGDKRIKLIVRDNKSDPATAQTAARELIDSDRVVALIGAGTTATTESIVDIVSERKVPTVSMGSATSLLTDGNGATVRPYLFKTPANTSVIVDRMLEELRARGIKKVGVLSVDNAYGNAGRQAFEAKAQTQGLDVVSAVKAPAAAGDAEEYTALVDELAGAEPDAVVVWAAPPSSGLLATAFSRSAFVQNGGRVYFDPGAGAEAFSRTTVPNATGIFMIHPAVLAVNQLNATTPSVQRQKQFYSDYSQRFGTFSAFASYAADALELVVQAIAKADSTDREKVRGALETISYDGYTGSFAFSPTNHGGVGGDALTVLAVRNGEWALAQ